jgi:hypothetical protein
MEAHSSRRSTAFSSSLFSLFFVRLQLIHGAIFFLSLSLVVFKKGEQFPRHGTTLSNPTTPPRSAPLFAGLP